MDPRNKEIDLEGLMYSRIDGLTEEQLKNQEGGYIYRYRYNGGGASQVWLGSGRYIIIVFNDWSSFPAFTLQVLFTLLF